MKPSMCMVFVVYILFSFLSCSTGGYDDGLALLLLGNSPTVISTSPARNAEDVAVDSSITATFSREMGEATITTSSFTLREGSNPPVSASVTYSGTTATLDPDSNLDAGTVYTATITTDVTDEEGKPLAADYSWSFTTHPAPTVVSVSPVNGAVDVAGGINITATFSEAMAEATITESSFIVRDGANPAIASSVTYSGTTATFNPSTDLTRGRLYTVTITTDVTSATGSPLASDYSWTFSTFPAHGYLDTAFSSDGIVMTDISSVANVVYDMALQTDGKIVVAGDVYNSSTSDYFALARYNADGTLDTTFGGGDGIVTTSMGGLCGGARGVAIQSDGRIVAVGQAVGATTSGYTAFAVACYESDGDLDTTFGDNGRAYITFTAERNSYGYDVGIDSSHNIVVAGYELTGAGNTNIAVARLDSDGALDTGFSTDGKVVTQVSANNDAAYAVGIQLDDRIVVAGYATISGVENFAVVKYETDGDLDGTFSSDGIATQTLPTTGNTRANAVKVLSSGTVLAAGYNATNFALLKYTSFGILDTTFSSDGMAVEDLGGADYGHCIAVDSSANIVFGGRSNDDFAMVRYSSAGVLDTGFGVNGIVKTAISSGVDSVNAIVIQGDGDIVLAGQGYNGSSLDFTLARYIQ
ncbi:MAG: Ig-like domain-containing protein [Spirochaetes bacterium]|nr:Ig-like domain-containing protein [Spirochaetota bacterium]